MSPLGHPTRALRALTAGLPRPFWILFAGTLVNRIGSFVLPFLSIYLTRVRGCSVAQAGLVAALYGAGVTVAAPMGGFLSDRFGRRVTMLFALGVGGSGMIALGFLHSLAAIAPATFLVAMLGEMYRPAMQASIADVVPAQDRLRAMGLIYWAINVGVSVGISLGGLLAMVSYKLLFVGDGLTTLAFGFLVWRAVVESHTPRTTPDHGEGVLAHVRDFFVAFHDRTFVGFFVLNALVAGIFMQHTSTLPIDMTAHGLSSATFGVVMALNGIVIVLVQPFLGPWLTRRNASRVLAIGAALVAIGFGLNAIAHDAPFYAMAVVVWTLGEIFALPVAYAVVVDLSRPESRGRYQGAHGLSWGFAGALAPLLGTYVLQHLGSSALWTGCLVVGLAVALVHLAWGPTLTRIRVERSAAAQAAGPTHG